MKKDIHPNKKLVTFKCVSCGKEYQIVSTNKNDIVNLDVCSNCHPVFVNTSGAEKKVRGKAEKLASKFKK